MKKRAIFYIIFLIIFNICFFILNNKAANDFVQNSNNENDTLSDTNALKNAYFISVQKGKNNKKEKRKVIKPIRVIYDDTKMAISPPNYDYERNLPKLNYEDEFAHKQFKDAQVWGRQGKITLYVVDSLGNPVPNANVTADFETPRFGSKVITKKTDSQGLVELSAKTMGLVWFRVSKSNYYETTYNYYFRDVWYVSVAGNRWIPWNPTLEVKLKEIKNPFVVERKKINVEFPAKTSVGFDFLIGDLVEPYGKGKVADVFLETKGMEGNHYNCTNFVSFSNTDSGLQSRPEEKFSRLTSDYLAPESQYESSIVFSTDLTPRAQHVNTYKKYDIIYFKIHRKDTNEIRYGKIIGGITGNLKNLETARYSFYYLLNPNNNDRNLECSSTLDGYFIRAIKGK